MALRLLRLHEVCARRGERPTSTYAAIKDMRLTPPIKRGRSSFWPESEIDALIAAEIAGKSGPEIRALVSELVTSRAYAAAARAA